MTKPRGKTTKYDMKNFDFDSDENENENEE